MAALIFDTGALIALERFDRAVASLLDEAAEEGIEALTSSACVAQAWRDPARQARLSRALGGFLERPLDEEQARRCGRLLARAGTQDIVDAAVAVLADDGDTILTSDPQDIERLLAAAGTGARVRPV
jgi:DNA-binding transcriptional MocR family regulator